VSNRAGRRYEQQVDPNAPARCHSGWHPQDTVDAYAEMSRPERDLRTAIRHELQSPNIGTRDTPPRLDSNQRHPVPEPVLYPLSYEGMVRAERFELPKQMHRGYSQARPSCVGALPWGD
jgi:hypothetical protein